MTTTILDIADTVAKVGLGALISGITTFVITAKNLRHTERKELANDKRQLLVELAKKLDEASQLRNKAKVSLTFKHGQTMEPAELKPELDELRTAIEAVREAKTNALLIGDDELAKRIDAYFKSVNDLLEHFYKNGPCFDKNFERLEVACNESKKRVSEEYRKSLERIHTSRRFTMSKTGE